LGGKLKGLGRDRPHVVGGREREHRHQTDHGTSMRVLMQLRDR
jgi:hypothetical protein